MGRPELGSHLDVPDNKIHRHWQLKQQCSLARAIFDRKLLLPLPPTEDTIRHDVFLTLLYRRTMLSVIFVMAPIMKGNWK